MSYSLFKYYRKSSDKFLVKLEKVISSDNPDITRIHNVRKELKKIRSLIHFYKFISTKNKNKSALNNQLNLLKELFDYIGNLREIQVNLINIGKHKLSSQGVKSFINSLKTKENKLIIDFPKITEKFNRQSFDHNSLKIKNFCKNISKKKAELGFNNFINLECITIKKILDTSVTTDKYHDIRIHLKKLAVIFESLYLINRDVQYRNIIKQINNTEIKLGKWHDNIILRRSIKTFLKNKSQHSFPDLKNVISTINTTNKRDAVFFDPDINSVLKSVKKPSDY